MTIGICSPLLSGFIFWPLCISCIYNCHIFFEAAVECKYPVGQRVECSELRPVGVTDKFASSKKCWILFCNFSPSCPHHHFYDLFSKLEQAQCNSFLSGLTVCTGKAGEPGGDRMVFGISELEFSLTWTTYQTAAVGKLFPHVTPVFCRMGETVFSYSC